MLKKDLLNFLKRQPTDIDAIGMILSNYINFVYQGEAGITEKNFKELSEVIFEYFKGD